MIARVLVTGGAGFIGANLCRRLLDEGDFEITVLDNLSTGRAENLEGVDVRMIEGSILDASDLDDAMRGVDSVVHLAARPSVPRSIADPWPTHEVNASGTVMVLESMRQHGVSHMLLSSSSSVYGANPTLPKTEDMTLRPMSPYAASKLAMETYALAWAASYGLDVLAFRFFNVFGPLQPAGHDYAAVVPAFVSAALSGEPLPVNGDGTQSRDFTFVDSLTGVIVDALQRRVGSPVPVNLAFGTRTTLNQVISELEAILGSDLSLDYRPVRAGDVPHSQADQTRFRSLFPSARPVEFPEALRRTVEWYRSIEAGESTADPTNRTP
jgi:UDP-glucose 4-epimerase